MYWKHPLIENERGLNKMWQWEEITVSMLVAAHASSTKEIRLPAEQRAQSGYIYPVKIANNVMSKNTTIKTQNADVVTWHLRHWHILNSRHLHHFASFSSQTFFITNLLSKTHFYSTLLLWPSQAYRYGHFHLQHCGQTGCKTNLMFPNDATCLKCPVTSQKLQGSLHLNMNS